VSVLNGQSSGVVPSVLYDEAYFLSVCEGYDTFLSSEGFYLSGRLAEALSVAGIAPGMQVLDVGCGRGEILLHTAHLGAHAYGIDYADVAVRLSKQVSESAEGKPHPIEVSRASALYLPFTDDSFDRILLLDIVEHLYPGELRVAYQEAWRVLKPGGRIIIHTAPNVWYDRFAYPLVRFVRMVMGQGDNYPKNPRAIIPENLHVHVNEQSLLSLWLGLHRSQYKRIKTWLSTPPQHRTEPRLLAFVRWILFHMPPFNWFFEREVFAVGEK
jgi:ubiquinone/menaquinone biosynthesis C-methylase UbiE